MNFVRFSRSASSLAATASMFVFGAAVMAHSRPASAFMISQVNGTTPATASNNEAESVSSVSVVNGNRIEVVVTNDDNAGQLPGLITYTDTDRTVLKGASDQAWNVRVRNGTSDSGWSQHPLAPPTNLGFDVVWSDPAVASNPGLPQYVFLSALGVPDDKFNAVSALNGTPNQFVGAFTDNPSPLGGACVARSTDGGQTFSFVSCFRDVTNAGKTDDNLGHFYDGSSVAVAGNGSGGFAAYAAFIDTETGREAVWVMDDVTSNAPNAFHQDPTLMGNTGGQAIDGSLGDIETHVRLRASGTDLWKMSAETNGSSAFLSQGTASFIPADLKVNIRNRNGNAVVIGDDYVMRLEADLGTVVQGAELTLRSGPLFDYDVGVNEQNQPEMRFVYVAAFADSQGRANYYLQGGYCTQSPTLTCTRPPQWRTPASLSPMAIDPAIKFGIPNGSSTPTWSVTYQGRDPAGTQVAVFAGNLIRAADAAQTPLPFGPSQATPFQTPCPDVRGVDDLGDGYWGDYDQMGFDPVTGTFIRPYTDSSAGCVSRRRFTSRNVHVSTVEIPASAAPVVATQITPQCALEGNGTVACWGFNLGGETGDGTPSASVATPQPVQGLPGPASAIASGVDSCALVGGAMWCWGDNFLGELGDGTRTPRPGAVQVQNLAGAPVGMGAGVSTTCALLSGGVVQCWGDDTNGVVGNGVSLPVDQPVLQPFTVPLSGSATQVVVGVDHACALIADGSVQCWGGNRFGQLGTGTVQDQVFPPVTVTGLSAAVVRLSSSFEHTCALLSDHTIRCWGNGVSGEMGNGTEQLANPTPVTVSGIGDAIDVSAGNAHTCAVHGDGSASCWGANPEGRLGNGTTTGSTTLVTVVGLATPAVQIAAGTGNSCARLATGEVECWGAADALGAGTLKDQLTPVLIQ